MFDSGGKQSEERGNLDLIYSINCGRVVMSQGPVPPGDLANLERAAKSIILGPGLDVAVQFWS